jgi:hypothetical protein
MKTLILLLLLSFTAAAAEAQPARRFESQATLHRQQVQARPPVVRQPIQQRAVVVPSLRPQPQLRGGSCGIGRWIDGVFTCQAGPVERALDRLNDTLERSHSEQSTIQLREWSIRVNEEQRALAQIEAHKRAADEAAYTRAMTVIAPPPAGLGPMPESNDGIRKRVAPNGTIIFSNVQ